jgi:hypothetical protein
MGMNTELNVNDEAAYEEPLDHTVEEVEPELWSIII